MALTTVQTGFQDDEGGEWTSLGTTTFTSDASTFDYEPTWFNQAYAYKLVRLTFLNIHPDTNNTEVYMRYKRSNNSGERVGVKL